MLILPTGPLVFRQEQGWHVLMGLSMWNLLVGGKRWNNMYS